jgi:hypothetical protein
MEKRATTDRSGHEQMSVLSEAVAQFRGLAEGGGDFEPITDHMSNSERKKLTNKNKTDYKNIVKALQVAGKVVSATRVVRKSIEYGEYESVVRTPGSFKLTPGVNYGLYWSANVKKGKPGQTLGAAYAETGDNLNKYSKSDRFIYYDNVVISKKRSLDSIRTKKKKK